MSWASSGGEPGAVLARHGAEGLPDALAESEAPQGRHRRLLPGRLSHPLQDRVGQLRPGLPRRRSAAPAASSPSRCCAASWSEDKHNIELFEREGKIGHDAAASQHRRDPGRQPGRRPRKQYYIVMEFVEGGNLREILNIRKKLEPAEALRILEDAAAGLAYAFSSGRHPPRHEADQHPDLQPGHGQAGGLRPGRRSPTASASKDGRHRSTAPSITPAWRRRPACTPGDIAQRHLLPRLRRLRDADRPVAAGDDRRHAQPRMRERTAFATSSRSGRTRSTARRRCSAWSRR